jgi:two-component system, cell cycle sensor histidine kinase and response regulator CckA
MKTEALAKKGPFSPISKEALEGFSRDQERLVTERVGIILLLGWAFVPLFAVADYFLYPQFFGRFLAYRLIAAVCCFLLYTANRRFNLGYRSYYLGITAAYVVALAIIAMILDTGGYSTPYYAGLNLVFFGMCTVLTIPVGILVVHSIAIYLIYLASVLLLGEGGHSGLFLANNMFVVSTMVIGLVANHVAYRLRLREYLVRQQLEDARLQLTRYSKDLENLIAESENMYEIVVDNANEGIFVLQDDVMKFPNPKTVELFGYPKDDLARMPFMEFVLEEDKAIFLAQRRQPLGDSKVIASSTFRIVKPSGDAVWVDMNAVSIEWIDRPAFLVFLRDVTEKKMMEAELIHAQKMEAIGTLAGGIAHDFNNLLTGISGYASLMLMRKDSADPHYERLKAIEQLVQSGADLTKQLLGFARGGKYEVRPTDLNDLVKKSSEMFGRTRQEIAVHRNYCQDIHTVDVDRGQIEQVLVNLYVNAWQAMPAGGDLYLETTNVTIDEHYARFHSIKTGDYARISVTDTGVGMDRATQLRIFEPFFTTKEMGRGTGLGLASAYGIIKNHGGLINVYSEIGKGTTFNIYLPASTRMVGTEEAASLDVFRGTGTILLVDDQEVILTVGKEMLGILGYQVLVANSGQEALDLYSEWKEKIDVVILDMIMPSMGGGETYDKLRAVNRDVKVILSSGYSINGQAADIMSRGCNGFIQKPFNIRDISRKLREILDGGCRPTG